MPYEASWLDILAGVVAVLLLYQYLARMPSLRLPPGPPRLPLISNFFDVPKDLPWVQYATWAKQYGDVISLSVFGQTIVVLNSHQSIKDVVLVRSTQFSGRPYIKFAEMAGWYGPNLPLTTSGREWRDRRRVVETSFRPAAVQKFYQVQQDKVIDLLKRIVEKPEGIADHSRQFTASIVMDVVYGYEVKTRDDYFVRINEDFQSFAPGTVLPGALIVNSLPFLGSLPPWMLGRKFSTLLDNATHMFAQMIWEPFEWLKGEISNGTAKESLVRTSLEDIAADDKDAECVVADAFGNVFAAAIDTTTSTMLNFVLNMLLNPHVQVKARKELDRVVGRDRLPTYDDRASLPYVEAILMEVMRWDPTTPLGVPHTAEEDVVLDSFYIPKGAIVIGNAWAILHDPERYPSPSTFNPDRHLSSDGRLLEDPILEYAFGYGTRKCPGRHFADATLWLYIATVLAICDIQHSKDKEGREVKVEGQLFEQRSLVHQPLPFACSVVPRDKRALEVVAQQ